MRSLLRATFCIVFIFTFALCGFAQSTKEKPRIPNDSKIFIAKMEGELDGFISSQILKKKLPVTVVTDENLADYIITGGATKGIHKWYDTVITGIERDRNQGSIQVVSVKDKSVIWADEAGDRSLWWGPLKKGGRRKVAERLVNKMKSELFKR